MTCAFCGSLLDGTESECPFCGHKVDNIVDQAPVEPKKSSAASELMSRFSAKSHRSEREYEEPEYEDRPSRSNSSSRSSSGGKANKSMPLLIGIAALLVLSMINMILGISINTKLSDFKQDMLSQMYQLQTAQNELSNSVNNVSSTVSNVSTSIEQSNLSRNINITKQPTEASTYVGRGGQEDDIQNVCIFSITAEGYNLSFAWQKFDEVTGSWVTIQFDPDNNDSYGLHIYSTSTYSELCAHNLQPLAFGSYRCVVSDSTGVQYSDVVTLTERSK